MYAIVFHAHQKLDRVAYRHLKALSPENVFFPTIRQILHFESGRGPDRADLKRPDKVDQPWHFIDPSDASDTNLQQQITRHYNNLVTELKNKDQVRAGFEAAWLAHALIDGLTPAHHYPYESELQQLRGGKSRNTRKGLAGRLYIKSDTVIESFHKSMKLIGPKGLLTSHALFEAGAYAIIAPLRLTKAKPSTKDIKWVDREGIIDVFKQLVMEVASLNLYDRFCTSGWITSVSRDIRDELAPRMVKMVTLAWYAAMQEARQTSS